MQKEIINLLKDNRIPKSTNSKRSSGSRNVDKGENQVSNGTQSAAPAPGIATVGNTGAKTNT